MMDNLAKQLEPRCHIETRLVVADLGSSDGLERPAPDSVDLPITVAVRAAGYRTGGAFLDNDVAAELAMIDVNCRALAQCFHRIGMQTRDNCPLGTILTAATAFRLGANGGHFNGSPPINGATIPYTKWSLTVGDLRAAHFMATHMIRAVPLASLALAMFLERQLARLAVMMFAALWATLCPSVVQQAFGRRPITERSFGA